MLQLWMYVVYMLAASLIIESFKHNKLCYFIYSQEKLHFMLSLLLAGFKIIIILYLLCKKNKMKK